MMLETVWAWIVASQSPMRAAIVYKKRVDRVNIAICCVIRRLLCFGN